MTLNVSIPRPANEAGRLASLRRCGMLDTPPSADFDFLTKMAAAICGTPYAFVSLVDESRVWYKSAFGCCLSETARDEDYCSWTILEKHVMYIADLRSDARTAGMKLTLADPRYRMYCGVNLVSADGQHIGTLCVLDVVARRLSKEIIGTLAQLALKVMSFIEQHQRQQYAVSSTH